MENRIEGPQKLQVNLSHDPSAPLLHIDSKEMKTICQRNMCLCLLLEHSQKHKWRINQCVHSQKTEQKRHGSLNAKWNDIQPPCCVWPQDGEGRLKKARPRHKCHLFSLIHGALSILVICKARVSWKPPETSQGPHGLRWGGEGKEAAPRS